jgi:hypothetical protein
MSNMVSSERKLSTRSELSNFRETSQGARLSKSAHIFGSQNIVLGHKVSKIIHLSSFLVLDLCVRRL